VGVKTDLMRLKQGTPDETSSEADAVLLSAPLGCDDLTWATGPAGYLQTLRLCSRNSRHYLR